MTKTIQISPAELAFVAGTRGLAGIGIGLLVAPHLNESRRNTLGWALLALGVMTTLPIAATVIGRYSRGKTE